VPQTSSALLIGWLETGRKSDTKRVGH